MPSAPPAETFLSTSAVHNHPPPQHVVSSRAARRPSGAIYEHLRWRSMQDPAYGLPRNLLLRPPVNRAVAHLAGQILRTCLQQKTPGELGCPASTTKSARRSGRVLSKYLSSRGIHTSVHVLRHASPSRSTPRDSLSARGAATHTLNECCPPSRGDVAKTPSTTSTDGEPTRRVSGE